ncbi:hypothetical protein ACS78V_21215 [Yersinia enterocolitica]|uniref:hypothetical protein n=1 Tax=Yersinia enterocolitica TaxID=630 RepID=UPI00290C036E|nr:hypothetical protein [Yersinia enterocolitica]HDL8438860.1 hypothetical protein [Yersinia enterocolitica]HEB1980097.1 hypothetical protein [Yersinia enterocolitica]
MTEKHTKGPFRFNGYAAWWDVSEAKFYTVTDKEGLIVAFVKEWSDGKAEAISNATLFSAAPELLEALKAVVAIADRDTDVFNAAKAAIAKATGVDAMIKARG